MKPKPTLVHVAKKAGVSTATASLILNNRPGPRFAATTRQRVRKAAEQLHYRGIARAANQRRLTGLTHNVAFMFCGLFRMSDQETPFYAEMVGGIQQEARRHGFELTLATGLSDATRKIDYISRMRDEGRVDGFMLASGVEPEVFDFLRENNLPVVFLGDHPLPACGFPKIHGDNEYGAYLATRHLLELGHRRIAFMGDRGGVEFYRLRLGGYCRAMLEGPVGARSEERRVGKESITR